MVYGSYKLPFKLSHKKFSIEVEKLGKNAWTYKRSCESYEETIKQISGSSVEVVVNPVEPVNLPSEITSFLLIELENELVLAPKENTKVFLTFPIEIGIILKQKENYRVLDIFSFLSQKYTLYGSVRTGKVCRYWKSRVYFKRPKTNPLEEGVLELDIKNSTHEWVSISRAVFSAWGMKIFYSKNLVSMRAVMKIINKDVAETSFVEEPLEKGMKKSIEIYMARKIILPFASKFVMEEGL